MKSQNSERICILQPASDQSVTTANPIFRKLFYFSSATESLQGRMSEMEIAQLNRIDPLQKEILKWINSVENTKSGH